MKSKKLISLSDSELSDLNGALTSRIETVSALIDNRELEEASVAGLRQLLDRLHNLRGKLSRPSSELEKGS